MKIAQEEVRQLTSRPRLSAVQRESVEMQVKLSALEEKNLQVEKELADLRVLYEREKRSNDLALVKHDDVCQSKPLEKVLQLWIRQSTVLIIQCYAARRILHSTRTSCGSWRGSCTPPN